MVFFQLRADGSDFGFVGVGGGGVFEAHQVHRRAFQLQLQSLAIQRRVQATDAVFVGAEAAMFIMIVIMLDRRMGDSQRQQGKRQSEQQTAHDGSPKSKM